MIALGFRIVGLPGTFTVYPLLEDGWQAQGSFQIGIKSAIVSGIYAGLASLKELPKGETGEPAPPPGVEIAS